MASRLKATRAGVVLGQDMHLSTTGRYNLGVDASVIIGDEVWLRGQHHLEAQEKASIEIGCRVHIGERATITALPGARIRIEDDCWLNHDISIIARSEIIIGSQSLIAPYCYLSDHNHRTARSELILRQGYDVMPIIVGSDVWLGVGATILRGASIGNGAVIAARAVVNKHVPDYEIWAGIPAKCIGKRK